MRIKLSHKIPLLVAVAALVSGLVVAYADFDRASEELRQVAADKLSALLEARLVAISDYLGSIRRDLRAQADNPFVMEAFSSFEIGREEISAAADARLRHLYVTHNPMPVGERHRLDNAHDASLYSLAHHRFHPRLRRFIEEYGYNDLILISAGGHVVYSVMKRDDFAVPIQSDTLAGTGLARVYQQVIDQQGRADAGPAGAGAGGGQDNRLAFADFEHYAPNGGRPTSFIGAPLIDPERGFIGVIVFEMPIDRISEVMQVAAGLGTTGETFIVGPDFLMRSNSRRRSESSILARRVATDPVRTALAGRSGILISAEHGDDGQAIDVLTAFGPLDFLDVRWAVVAAADLAEVHAPVARMRVRSLVHGVVFAVLVAMFGALVTRRQVAMPLAEVTEAMGRLADGDRSVVVPVFNRSDEIGDFCRTMRLFQDSLLERDRMVAEREQERQTHEVRRKLAEAIDSVSDGFALFDADETLVLVNSKYRQFYPHSAGVLVPGCRFEDYVRHSADLGDIVEAIGQVDDWVHGRLASFRNPPPPFVRQLADGRWVRIADHRTADGGTVCIRTDITEFMHREQRLRASEQRFRDYAEISSDWFWEMGEDLRFTYMSEQARVRGFDPASMIGRTLAEVAGGMVNDAGAWAAAAAAIAHRQRFRDYQFTLSPGGGESYHLSASGVPVFDGDNRFAGYRGTMSDITDRKAAEVRLRESEERFRAIARTVPIPIVITRQADTRVTFANAQAGACFKVAVEDALGQESRIFYGNQADRERLVAELHSRGWVDNIEAQMRRSDGSLFWALLSVQPMVYEGGPANLSVVVDISDLKDAEARLRESEARVRAIVDAAADAIVTIDAESGGTILEFNPAAERIFGWRREQAVGRSAADLMVPPHLRRADVAGLHCLLVDHGPDLLGHHIQSEGLRADGSWFPMEFSVTEMPLAGRVVFTAYLRDITERRRAEAELTAYREQLEDLVAQRTRELKQAEERLITAINTFKGGFALYDADECLVIVNDSVAHMMPEVQSIMAPGVSLAAVTEAIGVANGLGEEWIRNRLERYRGPEEFSAERHLPDQRWINSSVRHTPDGSTLFVLTDITEHKNAEAALRGALAREKELSQLQREFVSMTSHEFRTPLAIIDASVQRLLRRRDQLSREEFTSLGQEIRSAVGRMVGLIDAILSASRLDSGAIRFTPQPIDLRQVITDVSRRHEALSPRHRFDTDLSGLPDHISGDAALIDQVTTNLIANAVKYSPNGGVIEVRGWQEGDGVAFSVRDEGVGVPAADMPRLFERFFRARTSTGISGTGIGLHIVKTLVEMHGGTVAATSAEGRGTTMTVRLPLVPPAGTALPSGLDKLSTIAQDMPV